MHQTDTACSWLVCHSRGNTANCIHLPRLSGGPAAQFFGEASRASPQHGWRSDYSLRETLSPTQDQGQHSRPLHTHPTPHTHLHFLSTSPHTHSLHPRPNTTCPSRLSPHFPTTQTPIRLHTPTHTTNKRPPKLNTKR